MKKKPEYLLALPWKTFSTRFPAPHQWVQTPKPEWQNMRENLTSAINITCFRTCRVMIWGQIPQKWRRNDPFRCTVALSQEADQWKQHTSCRFSAINIMYIGEEKVWKFYKLRSQSCTRHFHWYWINGNSKVQSHPSSFQFWTFSGLQHSSQWMAQHLI